MTLSFRNGLLLFLLILAGVWGGLYFYSVFYLAAEFGWGVTVSQTSVGTFFFDTLAVPFVSIAGLAYFSRVYRKTTAPELFFFAVFAFSLLAELLRLGQFGLSLGNYPFFYGVVLTKMVWAFRFFGLFCLFCTSLYAFSFPYQNYGTLVGVALAASVFLALYLPLQTTVLQNNLLYALGDGQGISFFLIIMLIVIVGNFGGGMLIQPRDSSRRLAMAAGFVLVGWVSGMLFSTWSYIVMVPGFLMLGKKAQQDYILMML